ncbi:MAG: hypothetical protein RRB18_08720 [Sulfolobaceae archaeon]|jgi:hypothetical protein|nr:hypothetical protein [Sulfolobaceae archaeon]
MRYINGFRIKNETPKRRNTIGARTRWRQVGERLEGIYEGFSQKARIVNEIGDFSLLPWCICYLFPEKLCLNHLEMILN